MPWLKVIGHIYKYICRPFGIHYFTVLDTLHPIFHPRVAAIEYWTSPQPKQNEIWTYNRKQNTIINPQRQQLPYIHFLFFKKTPWLETDLYWRKGFYQINKPIENYQKIEISILKIK